MRTRERQEAFLAAFATDGTVLRAAAASGISRETVYYWEKHNTFGFK